MTPTTLAWVVGRGGLLGRHVESSLATADGAVEIWRPATSVTWGDARAGEAIQSELRQFFRHAARSDLPWRVFWCAGAGVVATSPEVLAAETALIKHFLEAVTDHLVADPKLARTGTLFFSSSAGAVYAASCVPPPFDEYSPVRALAPYGHAKIAHEELFTGVAEVCGVRLLIGRLSNLYGPGQNLSKPQGLIGHVGSAALRREAVSIYVPLDTIRDYLFAADAGQMVVDAINRHEETIRQNAGPTTTTKIFASEVETTVASVLGAWRQALRRPPLVALAASPVGLLQPQILSFRSRVWPEIRRQPTLLSLGIDAVRRYQLAQMLASGARRS